MEKAPWKDYKGNEIYEGNINIHPSGENGVVMYHRERKEPSDQWTVNYGGYLESRLCLQIGDKGQAIVFRT
jgi:hypothetical protein